MNEQGNDELEKVKIYTYADKRPDFIALQYKSIGHFLRNPFELIVFNNCSLLHYRRLPNGVRHRRQRPGQDAGRSFSQHQDSRRRRRHIFLRDAA